MAEDIQQINKGFFTLNLAYLIYSFVHQKLDGLELENKGVYLNYVLGNIADVLILIGDAQKGVHIQG